MKVLMINGSSRNNGCTRAALDIMAETFKEEGIYPFNLWEVKGE